MSSVKREFQLRYRNSLLGAGWTILNPLAMMLVYTLVFSQVMQARLPGVDTPYAYSIFLICGLLPWGLFADIVSRGPTLFIDQANLLKKIQLPKLVPLILVIASSLMNFIIIFSLFLIFLLLTGQMPGWSLLAILPVLLLQIYLAACLCLILAIVNVFFRDVASLTSIVLQFGFWLTPIVYAVSMVPQRYQHYLAFNPLSPIFEAYHTIFIGRAVPQWSDLVGVLVLCVVLSLIAWRLFSQNAAHMVDEL